MAIGTTTKGDVESKKTAPLRKEVLFVVHDVTNRVASPIFVLKDEVFHDFTQNTLNTTKYSKYSKKKTPGLQNGTAFGKKICTNYTISLRRAIFSLFS